MSGQSVVNGTAKPGATVTVTIDPDNNTGTSNSFSYTATANSTGVWSVNLASALTSSGTAIFSNGTASVSAVQTNVAGNTSAAATATYTSSNSTSYTLAGPTDAAGLQVLDANGLAGVDEGAGVIRFVVLRSGDTSVSGTVTYTTQNGSASAGSDYTTTSGTLTFAIGETFKIITVNIADDATLETNETVNLQLTSATGGNITTSTATVTINDNEQSVWSVASAGDVDEAAGFITYTVTRTGATGAATINFSTGGGSATAGSDYTAIASQTLSFAAGETSKTVQVAITNDTLAEGNETVVANISGASTGAISTGTATATILDNEQSIWSVASAGPAYEASGFLTFTVTRTGASAAATIGFGTTGGTATGGVDYTPTTQTLSFAAGEMSKTVQVAVLNDALPEDEENVVVSLTNASSGSIATATTLVAIQDDDQMNWSIASAGDVDEGAGFITYVVSRTGLSSAATVQFETAGGSATAGSDYTALSQSLSFAAGEMSKTVRVAISDDSAAEGNETVVASISGLSQGNNTSNPAVATIIDNDQSNWSVASVGTVDEGAGFITYTVSRTGASAQATINFSTAGGSATAGVSKDYTAVNQTLNFAAGEMSKTIQVAINDDNVAEGNETVVGSISGASAGNITTNTASATINDNDQSLWSLSSQGTLMDEGVGFITYIVSRTGSTGAADIDFATAGGTANVGSDYTAVSQTLSFAAGEMTKTVKVAIVDDSVAEENKLLNASISNATSGSIVTATTSVSLIDNDQSNWRVTTGGTGSTVDEGSGFIAYTVSRLGDASSSATIDFATSGTATAGSDYTAANQTLHFAAGERSKVVLVAVTDDGVAEGAETINAVITNNSTGNIVVTLVGVTIQDNDQSNWSVASAGDVDEGSGFITYTVTRTGASAAAHIDFSTAGGTATAGSDYTAIASQTLNFAAGEMSKTVRVAVSDDALKEGNETVGVSISNASAGNINTGSATATINDNDQTLWSVNAAGIDEGAGYISYVITRSGDTSAAATIDFDTIGGGATPGVDFVAVHQNLSFAAGETTQTVLVQVIDDNLIESSEILAATISNASSGTLLNQGTTAPTITDNDLSVWSLIAGSDPYGEGAGFIRYVVSRSGDASQAATISFSTVGGTATAGTDYTPTNQTLSFAVGEKIKTVLVAITDDAVLEGNETVIGVIANASVGNIGNISGTATLQDNDQSVWSVSTADVSEGSGFITYTITRSGATTGTASIDFRTAGGTAAQGVDYTGAASQTLTFAAGETTKTVLVAVTNDTLAEATNETVVGVISNATSGNIATASASASITDNDLSVWSLVAAGVPGVESGNRRFIVSRTDGSAAATVDFLTTSNSAQEGVDYTPVFSTLSFAVGETSKIVLVPALEDAQIEATEQVFAYLLNASSGMVPGVAFPSIVDDDATRVGFSIAVTTDNVMESAGFVAYTITRSGLTTGTDSVDWSVVSGGSATVGTDYTTASGTVTFAAGQTTKVVWVPLVNDATAEGNETLIVGLSNASKGAITTSTATATLVDDDTPASGNTYAVAAIANNSIESAGSIGYTITRSGDLTQTSTSYFRTNGGSAQTDGSDYVVNAGQTLSWAIGETTKVVFVQLTNDSTVESSETIIGQSATDNTYTAGLATATATVVDDDVTAGANAYAVTAVANILEGNSYTVFTITRSGDLTQSSTSYFKTTDGTASAASDYTAIASQTLNWVAGETTKQVAVQLTNDSTAEGAETINGVSSALADFSVQTSAAATIQDDDTWTAAGGVNDTLTTQTASGTYTGGFIIDTGDGNDAVTMGAVNQFSFTNIQLGSGNDSLTTDGIAARLLTAGAHYDGGSGVDTMTFVGTSLFNLIGATGATTGDMFQHFEILSMSGAGNQTINLSLSDVLEMTADNAVADTLRITGNAGDKLNLQALGKTLGTLAAGTGNLTDVDGATYNVVASTAGNANANDVTIGGTTYDVYQYNYDSHLVTLLVATAITTTVI